MKQPEPPTDVTPGDTIRPGTGETARSTEQDYGLSGEGGSYEVSGGDGGGDRGDEENGRKTANLDAYLVDGSGHDPDGISAQVQAESPPASAAVEGEAPLVGVTDDSLRAEPADRIRLSDPSAVQAGISQQHSNSQERLEQLRNTLKGFHGNDAAAPGQNTPELPLSQEELETLRAVVDAAINLHYAPIVSRPIIDSLEGIRDFLDKVREVLEAAAKAVGALNSLLWELTKAIGQLSALIASLNVALG